MQRWPDLSILLAGARAGSLSRAAKVLGVDQSTASRRLTALEVRFGGALFDRTPDGLLTTDLGERLMPVAESMERELHELELLAQGVVTDVQGEVRLAVPEGLSVLLLAPGLCALRTQHPQLRLQMLTGLEVKDLTRREADIALRFSRPARGDLVSKRVANVGLGVFASRELLAQCGPPRSVNDLPWVGVDESLAHFTEGRWHAQHVGVEPVFRTNSYLTRFVAVREGVGAALLTRAAAAQAPELVEVDLGLDLPDPMPLHVVTHRRLRRIPRIRAVWQWLEGRVRDLR